MYEKRLMFLILILLCVVAVFVGCESTANYQACADDPTCNEEIIRLKDSASQSATIALQTNPETAPVGTMVGAGIGSLIAYLVGIQKGKKIRKGR